LCIEYVTF